MQVIRISGKNIVGTVSRTTDFVFDVTFAKAVIDRLELTGVHMVNPTRFILAEGVAGDWNYNLAIKRALEQTECPTSGHRPETLIAAGWASAQSLLLYRFG